MKKVEKTLCNVDQQNLQNEVFILQLLGSLLSFKKKKNGKIYSFLEYIKHQNLVKFWKKKVEKTSVM